MFANTVDVWATIVFLLIAVASGVAWIRLGLSRRSTGRPLLEPRDRPKPFWTLAEFFVCFGMLLVCIVAGQAFSTRFLSPEFAESLKSGKPNFGLQSASDQITMLITTALASLLAMTSVLVWMGLVAPSQLRRYGLWLDANDLRLGLKAAFLILPPVLIISSLVNIVVTYDHTVLDAVEAKPTAGSLLLLGFMTIVLTPVFEEFLFRGLLQGGAEQAARRLRLAAEGDEPQADADSEMITASEVSSWPWWPLLMSSSVFAAMHIGQGGAPVPLFFLALALGYLYRQTGRLGPCIIVHGVLNTFTIIVKVLNVLFGEPPT